MFIKLKNKKKKGFSIGEVLLAIFVLSIGMIATFSLFNKGIKNLQNERDLIVASLLAQEGVEVVRNIRDNNWAARDFTDIAKQNDPPAFEGILIDKNNKVKNCRVDYGTFILSNTDCSSGDNLGGRFLSLQGLFYKNSNTNSKFKRRVVLEANDDNKGEYAESVKVTSMVYWSSGSFPNIDSCTIANKCVFSQSILTNWGTGT